MKFSFHLHPSNYNLNIPEVHTLEQHLKKKKKNGAYTTMYFKHTQICSFFFFLIKMET